MATFGERLRILREEKNMVQKEIGKLLDVSESTIGKYENDLRTPSPDSINKLADFFKVSTDYLLGRTNFRQPVKDDYSLEELPEPVLREIEDFIEYIKMKYKAPGK
ncbi:MAG: helix-turn-helix domain-containing protein [Bacillota bacterium]